MARARPASPVVCPQLGPRRSIRDLTSQPGARGVDRAAGAPRAATALVGGTAACMRSPGLSWRRCSSRYRRPGSRGGFRRRPPGRACAVVSAIRQLGGAIGVAHADHRHRGSSKPCPPGHLQGPRCTPDLRRLRRRRSWWRPRSALCAVACSLSMPGRRRRPPPSPPSGPAGDGNQEAFPNPGRTSRASSGRYAAATVVISRRGVVAGRSWTEAVHADQRGLGQAARMRARFPRDVQAAACSPCRGRGPGRTPTMWRDLKRRVASALAIGHGREQRTPSVRCRWQTRMPQRTAGAPSRERAEHGSERNGAVTSPENRDCDGEACGRTPRLPRAPHPPRIRRQPHDHEGFSVWQTLGEVFTIMENNQQDVVPHPSGAAGAGARIPSARDDAGVADAAADVVRRIVDQASPRWPRSSWPTPPLVTTTWTGTGR